MHPISVYKVVDVAYPFRLRGAGNSQNDTGLIWQPPSLTVSQDGGTPSRTTQVMPGMAVAAYELHNRSGTTGVHGLGVRIPNALWVAGTWTNAAATPFVDQTSAAQSTAANDFNLESNTANDGYVIASTVPFNAWSINVGTASVTNAGVTRAIRYSNATGAGWTALTSPFIFDGAAADLPATTTAHSTEGIVAVAPPADWGRTQSGGLSGIPQGLFAMNVRATTPPSSVAAIATSISIYRLYYLTANLANNGLLTQDFGAKDLFMAEDTTGLRYGDALVCLFETANPQNRATIQVRGIG